MATRAQDIRTRLSDAMRNEDKVLIRYSHGSTQGQRRPIVPIGWIGWRRNYLKALCVESGTEKCYRVDRIMDLTTA